LPPSGESVSFTNPTGTLTINAGDTGNDIVDVNSFGTSNGGAPGALAIAGGSGTDDVNVNAGISLGGSNALSIAAETIDVGAVTVSTANGNQSYVGALSLAGATLQTTGTGSVILGGNVTVSGSAASSIQGKLNLGSVGGQRTFTVADVTGTSATDLDVTAAVSNGGIVKSGTGTMRLGGDNSYALLTTVSAGTLVAAHANALGTTDAGTTVVGVTSAPSLIVESVSVPEAISIGGPGASSAGALQGTGTAEVVGTVTMTANSSVGAPSAGDTLTLSGQITASGNYSFTKVGEGTVVFSNTSNNYTGMTYVNAGTLRLGASEVIRHGPNTGNVTVTSPGRLDLAGHDETIGGLYGTGTVDNTAGSGS